MNKNLLLILNIVIVLAIVGFLLIPQQPTNNTNSNLNTFKTQAEFLKAVESLNPNYGNVYTTSGLMVEKAVSINSSGTNSDKMDYSRTNNQVKGVDEGDIIKTDGKYIYSIKSQQSSYRYYVNNNNNIKTNGNVVFIIKATPANDASIQSTIDFNNDFTPEQLFINKDKLVVIGNTSYDFKKDKYYISENNNKITIPKNYYNPMFTTIKVYDVSNKSKPKLLKSTDFEGNFLTSRMINNYVYLVVNSYIRNYKDNPTVYDLIPLYRESNDNNKFTNIAKYNEIGYVKPLYGKNFLTVASISLDNLNINKQTILGNSQTVYSSKNNLYTVQTIFSNHNIGVMPLGVNKTNQRTKTETEIPKTLISRFNLNNGKISYESTGDVNGAILNQFSMDESNDYFRIATTVNSYNYSENKDESYNNIFVLNKDLNVVGKIEGIAPGEKIYSARFIGNRVYLVTFRHIDPLFVIDLKDPKNPNILGKLKIPGYSDYLHPYDETHLIGVGKEVDASIDADKIHTEGAVYYTAIQGVKLALFDVSDVSNPIEMYKEVIGDRGSSTPVANDHKAFLFDKQKNLLVLPVTVAKLKEGQSKNQQGDFVFNGDYVYNLDLKNGFKLKGKITQYDTNEAFVKSGYYFRGEYDILRNLFINNTLYSFSNNRLQLNNLQTLDLIKKINLN